MSLFSLCSRSPYLSNVLSARSVMRHGSGAEWSVVGAGGGCGRVGGSSCYWGGIVAGQWAAGPGRHPQHPHRPAAALGAAAAVCRLPGVSGNTYTHTYTHEQC